MRLSRVIQNHFYIPLYRFALCFAENKILMKAINSSDLGLQGPRFNPCCWKCGHSQHLYHHCQQKHHKSSGTSVTALNAGMWLCLHSTVTHALEHAEIPMWCLASCLDHCCFWDFSLSGSDNFRTVTPFQRNSSSVCPHPHGAHRNEALLLLCVPIDPMNK